MPCSFVFSDFEYDVMLKLILESLFGLGGFFFPFCNVVIGVDTLET